MNLPILAAILKKDLKSLLPLVSLTALLFLGDALILRLDLLPLWSIYGKAVLLVVFTVLIISVFQLDSPVSLTEDWLCRPVRKRELLGAKIALVLGTVYLPHAAGTLFADISLAFPVSEILLDAVSLPDELFLILMPILIFVAIITRTFVQAFGVFFAIFVFVFVVPTPFVRPPGPLQAGFYDELFPSGMIWLAIAPARLASIVLFAVALWLVYWRRNLTLARGLLAVTVGVIVLSFVLPMGLMPWNSTFALQAASGPAPPADATRISLRSARTCFPAAIRSTQSTDAAFVAARNGTPLWDEEVLGGVGTDAVAFLTAVEARGLPLDWRAKLIHVQANYFAGGAPVVSLRPANFITDAHGGGALTHVWMLPESALQRLRGVQPELHLDYSLTLLKPREHRLATDGNRYSLPGLGWCSAKIDEASDRIDVDCFTAISHPVQISVQLDEIASSRVYDDVVLAPVWAQQPYSHRLQLSIGSARLAKHDTITVTAWENAGSLRKSVTLPGILGDNLDTCPLPSERKDLQQARWRDPASHDALSITVEPGVQLEVLDFGGSGSPILLLPGLGATAHSFDDLAPLLARKHRVVAMTRRGAGYSSRPNFGYDTPRLAQDVLRVMDSMKLDKVILVGHSIAGDELTWLGGHHAEHFDALIYLDAAYDRSGDRKAPAAVRSRELGRFLPPEPPIPPWAFVSFDAMTQLLLDRGHLRMPEGELIAFHRVADPALAGSPNIDGRAQQAITAAIEAPDYSRVKIPALAIYAFESPDKPLPPWYDANDREMLASLAERQQLLHAMKRESIELFRRSVEKGQVLEMQGASHYIIQSNPAQVLEAIENFVQNLTLTPRLNERP
jgi:non-heme chloroperoxidase